MSQASENHRPTTEETTGTSEQPQTELDLPEIGTFIDDWEAALPAELRENKSNELKERLAAELPELRRPFTEKRSELRHLRQDIVGRLTAAAKNKLLPLVMAGALAVPSVMEAFHPDDESAEAKLAAAEPNQSDKEAKEMEQAKNLEIDLTGLDREASPERVRQLLFETMPQGWATELSKVRYADIHKKITNPDYGGAVGSPVAGEARGGLKEKPTEVVFYASMKNRPADEWMRTMIHEMAHGNDWRTESDATTSQRDQLRHAIEKRVKKDDRFKSPYVEDILSGKTGTTEVAAIEYWAEICEQYFILSNPSKVLVPADIAIIEEVIRQDDPEFNRDEARMKRLGLTEEIDAITQTKLMRGRIDTALEQMAAVPTVDERPIGEILSKVPQLENEQVEDQSIVAQETLDLLFRHLREGNLSPEVMRQTHDYLRQASRLADWRKNRSCAMTDSPDPSCHKLVMEYDDDAEEMKKDYQKLLEMISLRNDVDPIQYEKFAKEYSELMFSGRVDFSFTLPVDTAEAIRRAIASGDFNLNQDKALRYIMYSWPMMIDSRTSPLTQLQDMSFDVY